MLKVQSGNPAEERSLKLLLLVTSAETTSPREARTSRHFHLKYQRVPPDPPCETAAEKPCAPGVEASWQGHSIVVCSSEMCAASYMGDLQPALAQHIHELSWFSGGGSREILLGGRVSLLIPG